MKKHLKYIISLFLALAVIATDCTLDFQSKSPDYYQSSYVVLRREIDFRSLRLFLFNRAKSVDDISFSILLRFLQFKEVYSFQTQVILRLFTNLHQNINSFINQSVFVNEIISSKHFGKSLYSA